jgi:hypothetical protein
MRQIAGDEKVIMNGVDESSLSSKLSPETDDLETLQPLTPDGFRAVLLEIDALGLTWTSDLPPQLAAKAEDGSSNFASEKLKEIEDRYPSLPNELGYVIWYALTGTVPLTDLVGSRSDLRAKAEIVQELLITPEFRDEFFFSQMVKVPSFDNVDWEVVVKTSERGVQRFPGNAYALVTILMESNSHYGDKRDIATFAINEARLEKLLAIFIDMRDALRRAREVSYRLSNHEDIGTDAAV